MKNYIMTYNQLNESNELDNFSFEEFGRLIELGIIDHPLLIKMHNYIKNGSIGDLYLRGSKLTYLPNWLTKVNGNLDIAKSAIEDIPDSLKIKGTIFASYSKLKEFRRTEVYGSLGLSYTEITKLPDNLKVHGDLSVSGIQFSEIPKNLQIGDCLYIRGSNLGQFSDKELHKMYKIGGEIYIEY